MASAAARVAPLTPEIVAKIGRAFGELIVRAPRGDRAASRPFVLLGHDGRGSADCLVAAVGARLAAAGVDFQEAGLMTTPGLATLVRELEAAGAVMISASHNPAHDNGIKIFGTGGEKLADRDERAIEAAVASTHSAAEPASFGQRRPGSALRPDIYLGDSSSARPSPPTHWCGMRFAFDGANGGGSQLGPELFKLLGAEVFEIGTSPDDSNINDGIGALHPQRLADLVVAERCALGAGARRRRRPLDVRRRVGAVVDGDGVLCACAPDSSRAANSRTRRSRSR